MSTTVETHLFYPAELATGDQVWHLADGRGGWGRVVAITSGDNELLVWCDDDTTPWQVPACERVLARHDTSHDDLAHAPVVSDLAIAEFLAEAAEDDTPDHGIEITRSVEVRMSAWYAGDLGAAIQAHAHHSAFHRAPARSAGVGLDLEAHLHAWYAGDLAAVMESLA